MYNDSVLAIANLCLAVDRQASEIYTKFAEFSSNEELKRFWIEMADEEESHVTYWNIVKVVADEYKLPHVFDDPTYTQVELERLVHKTETLLERWETTKSVGDTFILAYRLEFYMLHQAFEILFHTLRPLFGEDNPEEEYEKHINSFVAMFAKYGKVTPELELLSETLQSLWQNNKVMAKQVMTDSLTGLLNRRGFFVFAKQLSYLSQRNKENVGTLMVDIDNFKRINDQYGHPTGDEVLKGVGEVIRTYLRKSDIVGRYGGEEFVILLPSIKPDTLQRIADTIRHKVEMAKPEDISVTVSVGAAQGVIQADPDAELYSLIEKADKGLYSAKAHGKNCVVYCA